LQFPFALPDHKQFAAVGFGVNAVDYLIVVPEYPAFDTKTRLLAHRESAGGQTATAMVGLQRLGFRTAYAGRFGSDRLGQLGLQSLKREGVATDFAEVIEGATNQIAFILIEARSGERTVIWDRDERLAYGSDVPFALSSRTRLLHIDAHDPPACALMAQAARAAGAIVSADIDNIYEGLPDLLPLIDILITSKEFPGRLIGINDRRTALFELRARYGCPLVGMTLGVEGAIVYCGNQFLQSPAYQVPGGCRDTTGAGDAFHAGFLFGLLTAVDLEMALKFANAAAALKCRDLGGRAALPTRRELEEFTRNASPLGAGS